MALATRFSLKCRSALNVAEVQDKHTSQAAGLQKSILRSGGTVFRINWGLIEWDGGNGIPIRQACRAL